MLRPAHMNRSPAKALHALISALPAVKYYELLVAVARLVAGRMHGYSAVLC